MNKVKENDIICADTQKTRIENDLDNLYDNIIIKLEDILDLLGLDKNIIDYKLNNSEILQTELDNKLLELIEIIKY